MHINNMQASPVVVDITLMTYLNWIVYIAIHKNNNEIAQYRNTRNSALMYHPIQ